LPRNYDYFFNRLWIIIQIQFTDAAMKYLVRNKLAFYSIIYKLECAAELFLLATSDWGIKNKEKHIIPVKKLPKLNFDSLKMDIIYLPEKLSCSILDLLITYAKAEVAMEKVWDEDDPFNPEFYFTLRHLTSSVIGLKCLIVSKKIKKNYGIVIRSSSFVNQSTFSFLWEIRRHRRSEYLKFIR